MQGIAKSRLEAVSYNRLRKKLSEDMPVGTLIAYDTTTDEFVRANGVATFGAIRKPVGAIPNGSPDPYGSALDLRTGSSAPTVASIKAGAYCDAVKFTILQYTAGTFTDTQVAEMQPVYLGENGVIVTTPLSVAGDFNKKVGHVINHDAVRLDLFLDDGVIVS